MVGKKFPEAVRLSRHIIGNWAQLDGSFPQVDLLTLPARRILNIAHVWMLERLHGEKREEWLKELGSPLPGEYATAADGFDDSFDQIRQ